MYYEKVLRSLILIIKVVEKKMLKFLVYIFDWFVNLYYIVYLNFLVLNC